MPSMIEEGLAFFNELMEANAATTMTYHRGNSEVEIAVIPRRQFQPPISTSGPPTDPNKAERLLSVVYDDIKELLNGTMPLTTDYFTEVIDGAEQIFRVAAPAIGGPWWTWATGYRGPGARLNIQTKRQLS